MDGYLFPLPTLEVCLGSREDRSGGHSYSVNVKSLARKQQFTNIWCHKHNFFIDSSGKSSRKHLNIPDARECLCRGRQFTGTFHLRSVTHYWVQWEALKHWLWRSNLHCRRAVCAVITHSVYYFVLCEILTERCHRTLMTHSVTVGRAAAVGCWQWDVDSRHTCTTRRVEVRCLQRMGKIIVTLPFWMMMFCSSLSTPPIVQSHHIWKFNGCNGVVLSTRLELVQVERHDRR